ncbi:MAG: hypothetical protein JNM64_06160 [Chloroflexia bacterium]|nr:hypothetical protein [Chloroflexia bacterium]
MHQLFAIAVIPVGSIDPFTFGYLTGIVLIGLLGLIAFCAWMGGKDHAARQQSQSQAVYEALQRDLRAIERDASREARLASHHFLQEADDLIPRRRPS